MALTEVLVAVRVYEATDVPSLDWLSESDPYVRLTCQGRHSKTRSVKSTANPVWHDAVIARAERFNCGQLLGRHGAGVQHHQIGLGAG